MRGTYEEVDGRAKVRFERLLAHPIEDVWRALTERDELAHWFPSTVEGELTVGGALRFRHEEGEWTGEVRELDPPHVLAFTWGEDLLVFELREVQGGTKLLFTAVMSELNKAARDAAGWHVCLDRLEAFTGGADTSAPGSELTGEWRDHYAAYAEHGFPTGAVLPEDGVRVDRGASRSS
jgi:uncharacterized protein YndB with AHSA1/START domain